VFICISMPLAGYTAQGKSCLTSGGFESVGISEEEWFLPTAGDTKTYVESGGPAPRAAARYEIRRAA
jgi:hypothetical protein